MPKYEYFCESCQIKFEAIKSIQERHNAICKCGESAGKVMSVVNHTFGWTLSERSHERFGPRDEFVKAI